MRQSLTLIWKEWRETRAYLWIAIGVFIGLPVIRGVEAIFQHWRRFEVSTSPWVLAFGGVLAVFVAVGATCRDFNGHLDDFWRSRPISTTRWMLTKYLVGLVVVLVACMLPPIVELGINPDKGALPLIVSLIVCFPFIWTALYSVGFLAGCLVRRTAHAAMLAFAAMLLINFLPMVLPPLHWLGVSAFMRMTLPSRLRWFEFSAAEEHSGLLMFLLHFFGPVLKFAAGMLGIAIVALSLALLAVRRGWRIDSGRKMIYASVSAAILILVSSAAFQLGTSLPILQEVYWPIGNRVSDFALRGRSILIREPGEFGSDFGIEDFNIPYDLTSSGIKLGAPVESNGQPLYDATEAPGRPEIVYRLTEKNYNGAFNTFTLMLDTSDERRGHQAYSRQPLWELQNGDLWPITIYAWKDRLYVIGAHLVTLDISLPGNPRVISNTPFQEYSNADVEYSGTTPPSSPRAVWNYRLPREVDGYFSDADRMLLLLPQVPGLPPRQRLEVALNELSTWSPNCFEGDIVCTRSADSALFAYRVTKLTASAAVLEKIGQHDLTMLEGIFGPQYLARGGAGMKLQNGLLYVTYGSNDWVSFAQHYEVINPSISVFDTRGNPPMRQVGHFAAPGVCAVCPLPDGRALIGGDKLWLVGPPPHRGQD